MAAVLRVDAHWLDHAGFAFSRRPHRRGGHRFTLVVAGEQATRGSGRHRVPAFVSSVLVIDPDGIVGEARRGLNDLYVALTRTTKQLGVLHRGDLPAALGRLAERNYESERANQGVR